MGKYKGAKKRDLLMTKSGLKSIFILLIFCQIVLFSSIVLIVRGNSSDEYSGFQKLEIAPSKDSFVLESEPNENFGDFYLVFIGYLEDPSGFGLTIQAGFCETFLFFNLNDIKELNNVEKVFLILPGGLGGYWYDFSIDAYLIESVWDEYTITWANKPTLGKFIDSDSAVYEGGDYPEIDITDEVTDKNSISICLRGPDANSTYFYSLSKEQGELIHTNLPYVVAFYPTISSFNIGIIGLVSLLPVIYLVIKVLKRKS